MSLYAYKLNLKRTHSINLIDLNRLPKQTHNPLFLCHNGCTKHSMKEAERRVFGKTLF